MEQYEIDHYLTVKQIAPECMVLLKSDGSFPLSCPGEIALFGEGVRNTLKGGTGSGDVYARGYNNIEQALEGAGFTVTSKEWLDAYETLMKTAEENHINKIRTTLEKEGMDGFMRGVQNEVMKKPEYDFPLKGEGETAVYVLSRNSGEGKDRNAEKGDIFLTDIEVRDILLLQKMYKRFMLVLNVGGIIDLSPVAGSVGNILILSQLGLAVGDAFADVILGNSYPSGKLGDTWAAWEDYCPASEFGMPADTRYREGIYVGYRYFDSACVKPLFPFGFGLGYTTFEISNESVNVENITASVNVTVTNTGNFRGKEVVQVYVSKPETKRDQPYQELIAFEKTSDLKPGESEKVTFEFDLRSMASFDTETDSDVLDEGKYIIRIGNSSASTKVSAVLELKKEVKVQQYHDVLGNADFEDYKPEKQKDLNIPESIKVITIDAAQIPQIVPVLKEPSEKAKKIVSGMPDRDLALFCTGAFNGGTGSNSVIGNAGITVAGSAGETIGVFKKDGISPLIMADGPAGLRLSTKYGIDEEGVYTIDNRLFDDLKKLLPESLAALFPFLTEKPERNGVVYECYCTAIPIGTALASSYNHKVWEICGDLVASEMEITGVNLWLAPAMNIHRNPLCGRNFEYYSEDPLLSGKVASGVTRGVQKHPHCGTVIKHFCCNNQELNRTHSNSIVSRRALREIYLKGFRIAIDGSDPAMVMSSYNLLNGIHTSESRDLLETVLRTEWGYKGAVMSDWVCKEFGDIEYKYPCALASKSIPAGNDIMMPGTEEFYEDILRTREDNGTCDSVTGESKPLSRILLETAAARIIDLVLNLGENRAR